MSALAHYLEQEGVATTTLSLIRMHSERIRPPRALWVPYELGRPFGAPHEPGFQRRVLERLLSLAEGTRGPVVHEDLELEAPDRDGVPGWRGPDVGSARTLADELALLEPRWRRSVAAYGRTSTGLSGLPVGDAARLVEAFPQGPLPELPDEAMSVPLRVRFAADDLSAYAIEAALGGVRERRERPSSLQLGGWLWQESRVGKAILALRERAMGSADPRARLIGERFLVPVLWRERLAGRT